MHTTADTPLFFRNVIGKSTIEQYHIVVVSEVCDMPNAPPQT